MRLMSERPRLLFLAASLVAVLAHSPAGAQDAAAVREKLLPSVVLVERVGPEGEAVEALDLGLYVRPDVFATNRSSVRGRERIRARAHNRRETLEVRGAVCTDDARGLILLRAGGAPGRPPEFADPRRIKAGDPVHVLVAGEGGNLTVVAGRIAAPSPEDGAAEALLNVEALIPEGSIGAVVADARGRVLGLVRDARYASFSGHVITAAPLTHLLSRRGARASRPEPDAEGCAAWLADERGAERDESVREEEAQRLESVLRRPMRRARNGGRRAGSPPPPSNANAAADTNTSANANTSANTNVLPDTNRSPRSEAERRRRALETLENGEDHRTPRERARAPRNGHEARPAPTEQPPPSAGSVPPAGGPAAPSSTDEESAGGVVERHENYVVVRVFYGTDRKPTGSRQAEDFYGGERGARDGYAAGFCDVSIPKVHRPGHIEEPSLWRLEFRPDPERHFVLKSVNPLGREDFFSRLRDAFARTGGTDALVFVHGFNVPFADAARRTAQLSYDLRFNGVPLMYSWPSQGSPTLLSYTTDEGNVEWTVPHLKQFLEDLAGSTGGPVRIHLIAHSMGNRALTNALRAIASEQRPAPLFNQVILTAPDIDASVFERDIAPVIQKTAAQVTLYASSDDQTMILAKSLRGGYRRAGETGEDILAIPGVVTIDATGIDTSLLGHSYYAEIKAVLDDIDDLIRYGHGPAERKLRALTQGAVTYWSLVAAATAGPGGVVPGESPRVPGSGGGETALPLPALALAAALVLAAAAVLIWRLARRRRGAA